jgi:hypothetical protein
MFSGALTDGAHPFYVWLRDGMDNRDYTLAKYVNLLYDGTPPGSPITAAATPAAWSKVNSFTITWTNPFDTSGIGGVYFSVDAPPTFHNDGNYLPGVNINQITGITVSGEGEHTVYIWLRDNANNTDHTSYVAIKIYYDRTNPGPPLDVQATPNTWTNINSFDITWTNPSDLSGIIGAWYRVGLFPSSNSDGTFVAGVNITSIQDVRVDFSGTIVIYVWLEDNASNTNYLRWNTTLLYFDINPPAQPINLLNTPVSWTDVNLFYLNWTNQWDHSGIAGVYYKVNSPPINNTDGVYTSGFDIEELHNISVTRNGTNYIYIWLKDIAGNTNYQNYSYFQVFYDALAPGPPIALTPYPTFAWTSNNSFAVSWTLPQEHSGYAGAYYKLESPPTSDNDGTYIDQININYIDDIKVSGSGAHNIYVWLVDKLQNVNYLNYSTTELWFDNTPPGPITELTAIPSGWTDENKFNLTWTNPPEHSGIYGLYYWFSPPTENLGKLVIEDGISGLTDLSIPGQGEYTIHIWLIDNAYNMDYRNNVTIKLRYDTYAPDISHTRIPYATKNLPITLTALVTDQFSGVSEVKLFYKHDSDTTYTEQTMKGIGDVYNGEIPASFVTDEGISYYLMALDNTDEPKIIYYGVNGQTPYRPGPTTDIDITITEDDVVPPIIVHQRVTTGTVGINLALTATVNDDGSGVREVRVFYRAKSETVFHAGDMGKSNPYFFEIPGSVVTAIGLEYYLYALDNSPRGNDAYFGRDGLTTVDPTTDSRFINVDVSVDDITAPKIIFGPEATMITASSATILWITDEPTDSNIDYGLNMNLTTRLFNKTYMTFHSIILTDLTPNTLYYYRVSSNDQNDNGPVVSKIQTFKTMKAGEEDTDGDGISDTEDPDDDNDNMPDTWELSNKFDPKDPIDADLDSDNDGYSNLREYLTGSDPADPGSTPISIADTVGPTIAHDPLSKVDIFKPVTISVKATDKESGVKVVLFLYKYKNDAIYTIHNMSKSGEDVYTYELPGSKVTEDFEYYIEAIDLAFAPNTKYFGNDKEILTRPDETTDINVKVVDPDKEDDTDDGNILDDLGKPFGITDAGICLAVLIILIVLLICFIFVLRNALQARSLAQHSTRYKNKDAEGENVYWEGDEMEELDEVEDLSITGDRVAMDDLDNL